MENEQLENLTNDVKEFKEENSEVLKKKIDNEIISFKKTLPKEILTDDLEANIKIEVNKKMAEFNESIDIKPKAVYYSLKSELELNENATEDELTFLAYDFLEKKTSNKFLKKILKELKKENRHE